MPLNVYEQNICERIPLRHEGEGRWKAKKKKNPIRQLCILSILRIEILTRYGPPSDSYSCAFLLLFFLSSFLFMGRMSSC